MTDAVTVVVPTVGRPSLGRLLNSLAEQDAGTPIRVLVVDDRRRPDGPLPVPDGVPVMVVRSGGRGPAAARNAGWRVAETPWIAFLDDDVVCPPGWSAALRRDLEGAVDGSQGRVRVPRASGRAATDWERQVQGLERARWATADMAYRRQVLESLGGFDERFRRAYREDADLALRARRGGYRLAAGERWVEHPVPPADPWVSVRRQAGNQDDALLLAKYGWGWRDAIEAPPGRRPSHLATAALGGMAVAALLGRRHRAASIAGAAWAGATAAFAGERIRLGPRTPVEIATMALTSVAIPPVATGYWLWGLARQVVARGPLAVLFDRDGTLIEDVPYNGDPAKVRLRPGAARVCARLRARRIPIGVISNQSGVARGLLSERAVARVNQRVDELLGPISVWAICPHGPEAGCRCRKPAPGLVLDAARRLGVPPGRVAVVGDIGSDVAAAAAAGARGVLVPTEATRTEEVTAAPAVAEDLDRAMTTL
ncbi:MAG: HAD-IIIA family hydrolase, partial [Candidatus Dormibacteraeota bacterium]|nr:HAD-IIIA family hydrolase [Candidatus Dormibacteraeota bacterium]